MKAILTSGIAGSGKSTWAKHYCDTHPNTIIISTDALRYELFNNYVLDSAQEKIVQRTIMERVEEAAKQGLDIILDIAVVNNKNRLKWYQKLRQYYRIIDLVIFDIPLETCLSNNRNRDRHVPEHVIKFMNNIKQEPDSEVVSTFNSVTKISDYNY